MVTMPDPQSAPQPDPGSPSTHGPSSPENLTEYEDWRLLQEVLEERDREWWADAAEGDGPGDGPGD